MPRSGVPLRPPPSVSCRPESGPEEAPPGVEREADPSACAAYADPCTPSGPPTPWRPAWVSPASATSPPAGAPAAGRHVPAPVPRLSMCGAPAWPGTVGCSPRRCS